MNHFSVVVDKIEDGEGSSGEFLDLESVQKDSDNKNMESVHVRDRLDLKTPASIPDAPANTVDTPDGETKTPGSLMSVESASSMTPSSRAVGEFVCHYCDAVFRIRGYLTRHIKKHAIQKAYRCPFYNETTPPDLRCHTSGGFSRRDTYKTHLKIRHFMYPSGVKPQDRGKSSGHCAQCGEFFTTTEKWVENHIESGNCKALPEGFLNKFRSEKKSGRLRMIKTSTGHSRFISTTQSVVDPKVLLNRDALEAMAIVANNFGNRGTILSKYGTNSIAMNCSDIKLFDKDDSNKRPKRKYKKKKSFDESKLNNLIVSDSVSNDDLEPSYMKLPRSSDYLKKFHYFNDDETDESTQKRIHLQQASNKEQFKDNTLDRLEFLRFNYIGQLNNMHSSPTSQVNQLISKIYDTEEPHHVPLDLEQCPVYNKVRLPNENPEIDENTNKQETKEDLDTLFEESLESTLIAEKQLKDNEKYLNFYNFMFGSEI